MKEFMGELGKIPNLSGALGNALSVKYRRSVLIQPIGAFGAFSNMAVAAMETSDNYYVLWNRPAEHQRVAMLNDDMKRQTLAQKQERLMLAAKTMFIWSMSSVEFAMRCAMQMHPGVLPQKGKHEMKLAQIIEAAANSGFITSDARPLWFGANTIRNKIVHNNAIGDRDATWKFSDELTVTMYRGRTLEGTLTLFPRLTQWLVVEYAAWCDKFLAAASGAPSSQASSLSAP